MKYGNHTFKDWFFSTPYQRRQWVNNESKNFINHNDAVTRFIENRPVKHIRTNDCIKVVSSKPDIALGNLFELSAVKNLEKHGYQIKPFTDGLGYDVKRWGGVIFRGRLIHDKAVALVYRRDFEIAGRLNIVAKVPTNVVFQTIFPLASMLERSDFKEK